MLAEGEFFEGFRPEKNPEGRCIRQGSKKKQNTVIARKGLFLWKNP